MARTLCKTFGPSRPRVIKDTRLRAPSVRAAAVDVPNAVSDELEAQPDEHSSMYAQFDELLKGTVTTFKAGTEVRGTVVDVSRKGAFVDIGGKGAAFAATPNLCIAPIQDAAEILRPGMVRDFTITYIKKEVVQLSMAVRERAIQWQRLRTMQEEDITVPGTVVSSNRGGVMVSLFNVSVGFVPNSHLGPVGDKENMIGNELQLKFLEVDERNDKLLLSARRVRSADSLQSYRVGDVVEAVVTQVAPFGAFLELDDGISGLLHISQVSHDRVTDMEKLVNIGDRMKVMVMSHDRERERLALSTKKLEPTPGDMLKDPALVFARADEMAALFKIRVAAAEQAARETEQSVATEAAAEGGAQPAAAAEEGKMW